MQDDNYEYALERLYSLYIRLCGGYYEPKSERDRLLSGQLEDLLVEHNRVSRYKNNLQET